MISFPDLSSQIYARWPEASSLAGLVDSPTSRSVVGVLAARTQLKILRSLEEELFDLYVCEDAPDQRVSLRSPFALLCVSGEAGSDPETFGAIYDTLLREDLHTRPGILLETGSLGELGTRLALSPLRLARFNSASLLDLLLAHPPRTFLTRRVVAEIPLADLNPYIYRGPVGASMFFGREQQLEKLTQLKSSYALVGPRAIGKTSLMNRACERLRASGALVIRTEFGGSNSEEQLMEQIVSILIHDYGAPFSFQKRLSAPRLQRYLERMAKRFTPQRVAIFMDEADELRDRCPGLVAAFRAMHNLEFARVVLLGFKALRKAVFDGRTSEFMNVLQPMPLSRLPLDDCAKLIFHPMSSLDIKIEGIDKIAELFCLESGGAPNRIQLFCHVAVEEMSHRRERVLTPAIAREVIGHEHVQTVLSSWFRDSTTLLEKRLAAFAALACPAKVSDFIHFVQQHVPEWSEQEISVELQDLKLTDILMEHSDGCLNFTFPRLRGIALPGTDVRRALADLRAETRLIVRENRMKGVWAS